MKEFSKEGEGAMCQKHDMPIKFNHSFNKRDYCDICIKEDRLLHEEEDKNRDIEKAKQQRETNINNCLNNANIPERFKDKTFENYQALSDAQRKIVDKLKAFVETPNIVGLIIIGNTGTGKNHLAVSTIKEVIQKTAQRALIIKASKMIRSFKDNWITKKSEEEEIMNKYVSPYLLIINEIGIQFGSETEKQFFT
ncbi:MAG: ATP-binding protein [Planctomycetota bacterium]|jgi:DNA replication protein DnaC